MMLCHRLAPVALLMALACQNVVEHSNPARTPLIEAMLIAGTASTDVRIRWLEPDRSDPTDVPDNDVSLILVEDAGGKAALEPVPDSTGHFAARLPIRAGHRYSLAGTVGGRPVGASTTVPVGFTILAPAGDSIRLRASGASADGPYGIVPFRWSSEGGSLYAIESGYVVPAASHTTALSGELLLFGRRLRLLAMNRELAGYLYASPAETNLAGAFGVLGAAIEVRKAIVWQ